MANSNSTNRMRAIAFRLGAVLLSLSPLLVIEIGLRAAGYQGVESSDLDPFVDFESVRPLFERNADRREIPPSRQEYFRPEGFVEKKPSQQFRVFCLGGSTVQGRPYALETAFSTWLELLLQVAAPQRDWEVINCGGVSYASYRLTPIMAEVLQYEPDLIILYTGHNEFLEERTYRDWRRQPNWARRAAKSLEWSRMFRWARSWATPPRRDMLSSEVDAMLDYREGLAQYHRDDAWHDLVAEHYERNIERMVEMARRAGVPLVICNPVSHLKTPPFKSEPEPLRADDEAKFDERWKQATTAEAPWSTRKEWLEEAVRLSPRHADVQFALARCCEELRELDAARHHYVLAKDEDVCPLRMTEPLYARLDRVVKRRLASKRSPAFVWIDIRANFEVLSPGGITDKKWLVDHVHPSIHGHQKIAEWLLDALIEHKIVNISLPADFDDRRQEAYRLHLSNVPTLYFEEAKRRLEGLQRWAQGRAFKVRTP